MVKEVNIIKYELQCDSCKELLKKISMEYYDDGYFEDREEMIKDAVSDGWLNIGDKWICHTCLIKYKVCEFLETLLYNEEQS